MVPLNTIAGVAVALLFCLSGGDSQYDSCTNGTVADIGNGRCDVELNVPSCGYDGGDCCPCTCVDGPTHSCSDGVFDCVYPHCGGAAAASEESTCVEEWKSDGFCDAENLGPDCDYDGGDCCECSCTDGPDYGCGSNGGFNCLDPACFEPGLVAEFPDCTGDWLSIGDGACDAGNNNALCGYDGGDCCLCSCSGAACALAVYDCVDSSAADELFECTAPPPAVSPCSAEVQQTWVVDTSAQAQAMAAAVNCSGGSFEVEWRGSVIVSEPIYVTDGTIVAVTGADSGAVVDGNAATRLFTVANAVLSLTSVNVSNGASIVGGAIAASGSTLSFNRTSIVGNRATAQGGGVYVSGVSDVSCEEVSFIGNRADTDGGGMFVTGSSVVSCGGSWVDNSAGDAGGALSVRGESTVLGVDEAVFVSNAAERFGGVLDVRDGSSVSWSASTSFEDNVAGSSGGAVNAIRSTVSCNGATSYLGNMAGLHGGAVYLDNSSVVWRGPTSYMGNMAGLHGGAVYLATSNVLWDGVTTYTNNTAGSEYGIGGALFVAGSSSAWRGPTSFVGNEAWFRGGAVYLETSNISWSGENTETVFARNRGGISGGGIVAALNSQVSWADKATSTFSGNSAQNGGAIALFSGSSVAFSGNSSFDGNSATGDSDVGSGSGGAINVFNSTATWTGLMSFTGNEASGLGGVVYALLGDVRGSGETKVLGNSAELIGGGFYLIRSTMSWDGEMDLFNNTAKSFSGGGIAAHSSELSWTGTTTVKGNRAGGNEATGLGGGVLAVSDSVVSWTGDTEFNNNSASASGGALFVANSSEVSWSGHTEFSGNSAVAGGAVFVFSGASVGWTGTTMFSWNTASADGGAVGSSESNLLLNTNSVFNINGPTSFSKNICGANGGAMALIGGLSLDIGNVEVLFDSNHADVTGGAVFVSGTGYGPAFSNVSFVSNSAQAGGAVSMMASGNLKNIYDVAPPRPTTFDRCRFIGNTAVATGGAIESASGQDVFVGSIFQGNTAGTSGGALRLAGSAVVGNCSFVENVSSDGGGAAVSNIGVISKMENISFVDNVFACPPGMFLDFNTSGDPYEVACDGCQTMCDGCSFEEPPLVPRCMDTIEHAVSAGRTDTLEMLSIERGYWRATPASTDVLACYNADACLGGETGAAGYCLEGYEGPYCSICNSGYTRGLTFTCSKCSNSAGGIVLAAVLAVVALFVTFAVVVYVMSGKPGVGKRGTVERLGRYIPLQSIKIVIVAWQILTQFTSVANIAYPDVYQRFLDGLDLFNFDLSWVLSAGCVVDMDFHDRLLLSTVGPIVALLFLGGTYAVAARINRGATETMQIIWNKHMSMVLLLTFLVYSSVSSTVFKTFACENLDDGKNYLREDYRIECDSSKHKAFQVYAGLMIVLYTVGIPTFYGVLLFQDRDVLRRHQAGREETARMSSTSDLWKPYRPSVFYYEVIECVRRVLLAGVVVFIYPNTAAQVAVTLVMAFVFVVVSEALAPYASRWDTWLNRVGHAVVYMSMYVALLLKVDVTNERVENQKVFEGVLVAAHACMILVIVVETIVLTCALRVEQREEPSPRFRLGKALFRGKDTALTRTNPFSGDIY